jgi:selenocysteine lyase/cysteine desulfurase
MKSETCTLCLKELREELIKIRNSSTSTCLSIPIVFLSAVSNVTGVCLNLYAINKLIHLYGGLACWDFSSLASHGRIDFAGLKDPHSSADSSIDVGFFSTHKFLGGPGSSGITKFSLSFHLL